MEGNMPPSLGASLGEAISRLQYELEAKGNPKLEVGEFAGALSSFLSHVREGKISLRKATERMSSEPSPAGDDD
jgi:hypothetical protein